MVDNNHSPVHNVDKLRGAENYATWKVEMKSCLNRDGVWKIVSGREIKKSSVPSSASSSSSLSSLPSSTSSSAATTAAAATDASVVVAAATDNSISAANSSSVTSKKITVLDDDAYDERNETAFDTIVLGLTPPQQRHIAHCQDDGKTAWEVFERLYDASHAQKPTRLSLRRQLYKSPMDPCESMRDFINRKVVISEKLLDLGTLVDESELADCILMDVAEEYQSIVSVLERRGGYGLGDVKGALMQEETEKRQRAVNASAIAATQATATEHMGVVKREQPLAAAAAPLPPAPMQIAKKPLLGMGADHPPAVAISPSPTTLTSAPPLRSGNVPIAIARNRSTKRPHHDSGDDDVSGISPTSDGKKRATEDREDFKKPKITPRNGGRKQKIQLRREILPPSSSPASNPLVALTAATAAQHALDRPFTCLFTFASCTQTFSSKNEWKRHINHIHLQLWYWRCDYPSCANRKAFFNRKDLFGQHLKRMHTPTNSNEIQERCKKERRKPPEKSTCGFCGRVFEGAGGWEACVDHVGEHYTNGAKGDEWTVDKDFVDWAVKEGVVQKGEGGVLVQDPRVFPVES